MSSQEHSFTPIQYCRHCGNSVPLEIVARHSIVKTYDDYPRDRFSRDHGIIYELLSCPACEGVMLTRYYDVDRSIERSEFDIKILYPDRNENGLELVTSIPHARQAIDLKARAVMLRRLAVIHECNKTKSV